MIKTVIKKGTYHDSVVLMLLTNQISAIKGVKKVSIMMATPANKDIFRQSGLETDELLHASANDMAVVMDIEKEELVPEVLTEIEHFFEQKKNKKPNTVLQNVNSWEKALAQLRTQTLQSFPFRALMQRWKQIGLSMRGCMFLCSVITYPRKRN